MSSRRQTDHLERTASNYRQDVSDHPAVLFHFGIMDKSETVKRLRLAVHPDFTFRAGQWVDFFIPGMEKVGGFSVCSSPGLLQREGVIELAVKYTEHPPPHICTMDSHVAMRVGGNFFFDPLPSDSCVDLMLGAWALTLYTPSLGRGYNIGSTHLCYSAKNAQELLFKKTIIDVCKEFPEKFSCDIHITAQMADIDQELQPSMYQVGSCVATSTLTLLCYLCGPPPMIESVVQTLLSLGLSQDRILFEKWW
uniref:Oxidoreductase NAD-binding domain containing 1 n=1 Tax=Oncorhynchus kisutch TaxID=8019 RepID=A0A8C7CZK8_ONCKI